MAAAEETAEVTWEWDTALEEKRRVAARPTGASFWSIVLRFK